MESIIAFFIIVLIGGISFWIIAKLFSGNPPNIVQCFLGAAIAEFVDLFGVPFLSSIVLFIILIKVGGFGTIPAFIATFWYGFMKIFIIGAILLIVIGSQ